MKSSILILAGFALFAIAPLALAQSSTSAGSGRGSRNYNPATETTVQGTVEEVMQTTGQHGWSGIHVSLKSNQGMYDVHVGPASYLSAQQFTISKGDSLEVTGSRTKMNNKDVLIARQITKEGKTLTLRDAQGYPKWSMAASPTK
jgi:DNA/RNA endonuclease YhcR with UshA esterase domain